MIIYEEILRGINTPGTAQMIFEWETHDERLRRFMKISPPKKLEWLHQMHEFMLRTSSKRVKAIRLELRRKRRETR